MRSKLTKLVLGCGFAAAMVAPALACDYYHMTSAQNDQPVAQSQQTPTNTAQTPDAPQTAESQPQPAADTGSN
jgi:hypothetical protein